MVAQYLIEKGTRRGGYAVSAAHHLLRTEETPPPGLVQSPWSAQERMSASPVSRFTRSRRRMSFCVLRGSRVSPGAGSATAR
jgi:hypothetical protein